MDSGTKAVVLDIDGTLTSLTRGVGEIYAELLAAQGFESDAAGLAECAIAEWRSFQPTYLNVEQGYRTDPERERWVWHEYVRGVLTRAGLASANRSDVVECIYHAFSTKAYRVVAPGAVEFLRKARQRGVFVVAATNNDDRSKRVLLELGISEHLDGIFSAGELGWKKPSVEFFRALERRLGRSSSSLLHVGNNTALDVEPARHAGWEAVHFGIAGGRGSGDEREVLCVADFLALEKILGL